MRWRAARRSGLGKLRGDDWVSLSDAVFPGRREFLRAVCWTAGFEPRIVAEAESVALMLAAVARGLSVRRAGGAGAGGGAAARARERRPGGNDKK